MLGLVLHAIVSYRHMPLGGAWTFRDPSGSAVWTHLLFFIHVFRMPVFYVMAGFFAAMLMVRRGPGGLVRNRATRILVPFAIGWVILLPLAMSGFVFGPAALGGTFADGWAAVREMTLWNGFYRDSTIHLWFLYYLLWFYLVAIVVTVAMRFVPEPWRRGALNLFARLMQSRWRVLWLAIPTFVMLWFMPNGILVAAFTFIPAERMLLIYGLFFGFGWLLYLKRETLSSFGRHAMRQVVLALLLAPVNTFAAIRAIEAGPDDLVAATIAAVTAALIVWLLMFGLTGLFQRYLGRPSPLVRYFVDASYWVYLLHLPFMIWLPVLMSGLAWPSIAKITVVFGVTTVICVFTYDLFVRPTFIGAVLNGRRYPRGLPVLDAAGVPVQQAAAVPDAAV